MTEATPDNNALDVAAIKQDRIDDNAKKKQGRAYDPPITEPWDSPVDGGELLTALVTAISKYVVFPRGGAEIAALWALHTHCFDCFDITPRLAVLSPEKGCGKTTFVDVLAKLVAKPLAASNASTSVMFRVIERDRPTLLIDEGDSFLSENEELRGIINSGNRQTGGVLRTVGDNFEPRQFSTWAPVAIAMIGRPPDTIEDRSVFVRLTRATRSEQPTRFRQDRARELDELRRKICRWCQDNETKIKQQDPDMGELFNRQADNFRALFALCDVVGGEWPDLIRSIAFSGRRSSAEGQQSDGVMLLGDIRDIFADQGKPWMSSIDIISQLILIEDRPWAEWKGGKAITPHSLAGVLRNYRISPDQKKQPGGQVLRGYARAQFDDAFDRFLSPESDESATSLLVQQNGAFPHVSEAKSEPLRSTFKPLRSAFDHDAKRGSNADKTGLGSEVAVQSPPEDGGHDPADDWSFNKTDDYPELPHNLDRRGAA